MPRDLLIVLLCELGERTLALRELLAEPTVAAKPHARAVSSLLAHGLDALDARLQRDVVPLASRNGAADPAAALRAIDNCGRAFGRLHRRLGLLEMRWNAAPVDIFLRKLREDVGDLPHPAVVLTDDYRTIDDDVNARLRADLAADGLAVDMRAAEPVIALPRLEVTNPLAWPLLIPALARLHSAADATEITRLGGPAAFAARAAHTLITTPANEPVSPLLSPFTRISQAYAIGVPDGTVGLEGAEPVSLFARLARERDEWLGLRDGSDGDDSGAAEAPLSDLPTADETAALLEKLAAGTPINAIAPPLPPDFVARLEAIRDPTGLYDLIEPLGERPASLAAILGVGWLYKVRYSYPLLGESLRAGETLRAALAAYRPHMIERNQLLLQSIEAAHVQGIFARGRLDA